MVTRGHGFTLIEVMVAIAILSVLLSIGVPTFFTYLNNVRLRISAESFLAGLQTARSEAIRLNSNVEFLLTNQSPTGDDGSSADYPALQDASGRQAANMVTATANGYNWLVRTVSATGNCDKNNTSNPAQACWLIAAKAGAEGGGRHDAGSSTPIEISGTAPANIIFTPFGGTSLAANVTFEFTNPSAGNCVSASGPVRCLNVVITSGGRARVCDPSITDAKDTRSCAL